MDTTTKWPITVHLACVLCGEIYAEVTTDRVIATLADPEPVIAPGTVIFSEWGRHMFLEHEEEPAAH